MTSLGGGSSNGDSSDASVSRQAMKRAGSTESDESYDSKKSRSLPLDDLQLEPYVRKRRGSCEKIKQRLQKLDPDEQDRLRQCINSRERKRMHDLNSALDILRNTLPHSKMPNSRKLSKINTIVFAAEWIRRLTADNEDLRQRLSSDSCGSSVPPPPPPPEPMSMSVTSPTTPSTTSCTPRTLMTPTTPAVPQQQLPSVGAPNFSALTAAAHQQLAVLMAASGLPPAAFLPHFCPPPPMPHRFMQPGGCLKKLAGPGTPTGPCICVDCMLRKTQDV